MWKFSWRLFKLVLDSEALMDQERFEKYKRKSVLLKILFQFVLFCRLATVIGSGLV